MVLTSSIEMAAQKQQDAINKVALQAEEKRDQELMAWIKYVRPLYDAEENIRKLSIFLQACEKADGLR